jgi:hypothetical protein
MGSTALGILLYALCIWPIIQAYHPSPAHITSEPMAVVLSLDAISFFLPPYWQFFGGPQLAAFSARIYSSFESMAFLGWTELLLLGIGLTRWYKVRRNSADKEVVGFWVLLVIVGVVLGLGPKLRILGAIMPLSLPFHLLDKLPIINTLSSPARFVVLALLGLAMLVGIIIKHWFGRLTYSPKKAFILSAALTIAIVGERWVSPYTLRDNRPSASSQFLRQAPDQGAVLDVPLGFETFPDYTFSQYLHGRPVVSAYMSRYTQTPARDAFILTTPELRKLTCGLDSGALSIRSNTRDFAQFLQSKGISYIAVHRDLYCADVNIQEFLDYLGNKLPAYTDATTVIFRVADLTT